MKSIPAWKWLGLLLPILVAVVGGCASSGASSYIHPNVDFSHISRCAVLPFENLSSDDHADERVHSIFFMKILEDGVLELVGSGEAIHAVRQSRVPDTSTLSAEQAKQLGQLLSVDALFVGTVEKYGIDKSDRDRASEITATFGLVETETGVTVWQAQVHAGGTSIWRRLFGLDSPSQHDVSRTAVEKALKTLF